MEEEEIEEGEEEEGEEAHNEEEVEEEVVGGFLGGSEEELTERIGKTGVWRPLTKSSTFFFKSKFFGKKEGSKSHISLQIGQLNGLKSIVCCILATHEAQNE